MKHSCRWTVFLLITLISIACGPAEEENNGNGDGGDEVFEITEGVTTDTTWEAGTYVMDVTNLTVSAQLTIEACSTIKVNDRIFVEDGGAIIAQGTEDCPVTFTANKDNPAPGDWRYIRIAGSADNANLFEYTIFEYGGNEHGIVNHHGGASFRNSTVRHTADQGMKLHDGSLLEFTNMTFEEIGGHPFSVSLNDADMVDGVTTSNVQDDMIRVENGTLTSDGTWQPQSIPYQLVGDFRLEAILEVEAGTTLKMTPSDRGFINDGGAIRTLGTEDDPVVIESANSTPAPGDWRHIRIEDSADNSNLLRWTTVRHGGGGDHGAIRLGGTLTLENATFEQNDQCDIHFQTSNATVDETDSPYTTCN